MSLRRVALCCIVEIAVTTHSIESSPPVAGDRSIFTAALRGGGSWRAAQEIEALAGLDLGESVIRFFVSAVAPGVALARIAARASLHVSLQLAEVFVQRSGGVFVRLLTLVEQREVTARPRGCELQQ